MFRSDGLNNPLSINSGLGCTWRDVKNRADKSNAVEAYEKTNGGLAITWVGEIEPQLFRDPQAALIAIKDMEAV